MCLNIPVLIPFYVKNKNYIKVVHVNISIVHHPFHAMRTVMHSDLIDVISIQYIKVD